MSTVDFSAITPNTKMGNMLVVFESHYGQSAKIAHHLADLATRRGHLSTVLNVSAAGATPITSYDAVFIVSPIYDRHHAPTIDAFVRTHADHLSKVPSALVSVSMGAGSPRSSMRPHMQQLAREFLKDTGWRPAKVILAGGAIAYPAYTRAMRLMMKVGAWYLKEPTDTSRVGELTDWQRLDSEALELIGKLGESKPRSSLSAVAAQA